MKDILKHIKIWGLRDYLCYYAPKPLSYLGDAWNWFLPRYRYNWLDKIKCTLNPRQRWIKKHIEYNQWCDKVKLIPKFLFGCVVHFVEEEKCFERIDWHNSGQGHKKAEKELKECYYYIKYDRPALEQQLEDAYDNLTDVEGYHEKYKKVNDTEKEIDRLDQKYMIWIVTNKAYLWV